MTLNLRVGKGHKMSATISTFVNGTPVTSSWTTGLTCNPDKIAHKNAERQKKLRGSVDQKEFKVIPEVAVKKDQLAFDRYQNFIHEFNECLDLLDEMGPGAIGGIHQEIVDLAQQIESTLNRTGSLRNKALEVFNPYEIPADFIRRHKVLAQKELHGGTLVN